jgi:hypothetical protein
MVVVASNRRRAVRNATRKGCSMKTRAGDIATMRERLDWVKRHEPRQALTVFASEIESLLDDLDELRECLLLARPYVPELLNGKPLGVYARCTAALGEPKEPHA